MNSTGIQTVSEIATFIGSIGASAFVAGTRWGQVKQDLTGLKERLVRIEAMFEMKIKDK